MQVLCEVENLSATNIYNTLLKMGENVNLGPFNMKAFLDKKILRNIAINKWLYILNCLGENKHVINWLEKQAQKKFGIRIQISNVNIKEYCAKQYMIQMDVKYLDYKSLEQLLDNLELDIKIWKWYTTWKKIVTFHILSLIEELPQEAMDDLIQCVCVDFYDMLKERIQKIMKEYGIEGTILQLSIKEGV